MKQMLLNKTFEKNKCIGLLNTDRIYRLRAELRLISDSVINITKKTIINNW